VRDSVRAVKKAEFDARRQKLLDDKQKRRDSILKARGISNPLPDGNDDSGGN
jgi:hypothetical protein